MVQRGSAGRFIGVAKTGIPIPGDESSARGWRGLGFRVTCHSQLLASSAHVVQLVLAVLGPVFVGWGASWVSFIGDIDE